MMIGWAMWLIDHIPQSWFDWVWQGTPMETGHEWPPMEEDD